MKEVYHECTICSQPLSELEKRINEEHDNLYYPICDHCLGEKTARILDIVDIDPEDDAI